MNCIVLMVCWMTGPGGSFVVRRWMVGRAIGLAADYVKNSPGKLTISSPISCSISTRVLRAGKGDSKGTKIEKANVLTSLSFYLFDCSLARAFIRWGRCRPLFPPTTLKDLHDDGRNASLCLTYINPSSPWGSYAYTRIPLTWIGTLSQC